jgi:amidase
VPPAGPGSIAGLRVGVVRNFGGAGRDPAVESSFATALRQLEAAGLVLVDPVMAAMPAEISNAERLILVSEFKEDLAAYLEGVRAGPRTFGALVEFNEAHAAEVMPYFGQELFLAAHEGLGTADPGYAAAVELVTAQRAALAALFRERDLVALVAPVNGRAWRTDYLGGDSGPRVGSSRIAAITGFPSVAVPAALAAELPIGVAFIGQPQDEARLLAIAAAFERVRGPFPEPKFLATIAD